MLPLAIEAGMPLDVFWYEDMRYFKVYSMAYANRNSQNAWLTGLRVYEAVNCALHNAFSGKNAVARHYSDSPNRIENTATAKPIEAANVATWANRIKQLKGMSKEA